MPKGEFQEACIAIGACIFIQHHNHKTVTMEGKKSLVLIRKDSRTLSVALGSFA